MDDQRPRVGIGVMVFKKNKILLGRRKSSHGAGEYATPGGHLEYMEGFQSCAKREVLEETGLEIINIKFLCLLNFKDYAPKHYVHIWLTAEWKSGEAKVLEPEKCEAWDWYEIEHLPQPLFKNTRIALEALETGNNFFDA